MGKPVRAIILTGFIVGALDIASAIILTLYYGRTITRLMQFIASGLLGKSAFEGGMPVATLGLVLHFFIAFSVVIVFYFVRQRFAFAYAHPIPSGIFYGLIVYAVMNLIVLPLSAAHPRYSLSGILIQIGIHMFIIGLPTAFLLEHFSGISKRYE